MSVSIHLDQASMRILGEWPRDAKRSLTSAVQMASSSAQRAMRAEASRQVRGIYAIGARYVGRHIKVMARPAFGIVVSGAPIKVNQFAHTQTGQGISYRHKVGEPRVKIRGAFKATLSSGHQGAFKRAGKSRRPVNTLWTTGIASAFKAQPAVERVTERGREVLGSAVSRLFDAAIRGR